MQHLNTLWQAISAASMVGEMARGSQTFYFNVTTPQTFYLQAEHAEARIVRWNEAKIEVAAQLQLVPGWRIVTDQDEAGVYVVAKRRAVVGAFSSATFHIFVPHDTYLILKLADGRVTLDQVDGVVHITPPGADGAVQVRAGR